MLFLGYMKQKQIFFLVHIDKTVPEISIEEKKDIDLTMNPSEKLNNIQYLIFSCTDISTFIPPVWFICFPVCCLFLVTMATTSNCLTLEGNHQLEWAASNGNRYPPYPQVMATAISQ